MLSPISRCSIISIIYTLIINSSQTVDDKEDVLFSEKTHEERDFNESYSFVDFEVEVKRIGSRVKRQSLQECPKRSRQDIQNNTCPPGTFNLVDRIECCVRCPEYNRGYHCELNTCTVVYTCSSFYRAPSSLELGENNIWTLSHDVFHGLTGVLSLNLYDNNITAIPNNVFKDLSELSLLDLGSNNITDLPINAFRGLSSVRYLDLSGNNITILHNNLFSDMVVLSSLFLQHNKITVIPRNAFNGLSKLRELHLQNNRIAILPDNIFTEMIFSGQRQIVMNNDSVIPPATPLLNLNQLDLSNNLLTHLPHLPSSVSFLSIVGNNLEVLENMFEGLVNLKNIHTNTPFMCCVKPASMNDDNCFETELPLWECNYKPEKCKPKGDAISSCYALVGSTALRACLWIIGMSALIGNLFVIIYRLFLDRENITKNYSLFTLNLAMSDLLMGIYLLIIGIVDAYYDGIYAWNDQKWRKSVLCNMAGVLSSVSSEMSTFVILMVTIDRLIVIMFPLSRLSRLTMTWKHALIISLLLWTVSITLAVIPIFAVQSYFKGEFYSQSSVCLALPLTGDERPGTGYSFAVFVCLNSIFFVFIFVGQICIFISLKRSGRRIASTQNRKREMTVAITLFFVVLSDFCCWFPIGVMGVVSRYGVKIPDEVYAWVMVFVLPINAAINPFLYTATAIRRMRQKISVPTTQLSRRTAITGETT